MHNILFCRSGGGGSLIVALQLVFLARMIHSFLQPTSLVSSRRCCSISSQRLPPATTIMLTAAARPQANSNDNKERKLSESDQERLLLSETGMTAFIVAEMRHFLNKTMVEYDNYYSSRKWTIPTDELSQYQLQVNETTGEIINEEYHHATEYFSNDGGNNIAVDVLVNATKVAIADGYQQTGLWSALGSAILYFRDYYRRTPTLLAACERIGLSDYDIAHHITDMYHHRNFRGTYTKTLQPSGVGEIAARFAVGLPPTPPPTKDLEEKATMQNDSMLEDDDIIDDDDDECMLWSPTTPGLCLHWKSDDEAWRKKRFERIQMEGTRDPRRGGSGTTR